MTKRSIILGAVLAVFVLGSVTLVSQTTIFQRPRSSTGLSTGVGYGTTTPTVTNSDSGPIDGEIFCTLATSTSNPVCQVYSDAAGAWLDFVTESASGVTTLGADDSELVQINAPTKKLVWRTDFDSPIKWSMDVTNADFTVSVADTEANVIFVEDFPIYYRNEQAFAGTFDLGTVISEGTAADGEGAVFLIDSASILDVADNDAIEYVFGVTDPTVGYFQEDQQDLGNMYCEISARIDDISDISANDFYFGWFLDAAIADAFGYEGANTWAAFGVLDTAGDLVIQAELNGGTHGEDDAGVTIADDTTYVLRVTMGADAVAFYINGTAVAQTNAVVNADNGDEMNCRLGIRSAGTSAATIEVEYVEIGYEQ